MNYVQECVYIGSADDAYDTLSLAKHGITHILSVEHRPLRKEVSDDYVYKYVHALDMDNVDLLSHFTECIEFIDSARQAGAVLVHCYFGQSRSATIVLAWLMHKMALTLDDALLLLMKHRPQIRPNPGFHEQLELFESMGNVIDPHNEQYKLYRLNTLARQIQAAQLSDARHVDAFSADPCGAQPSDKGDVLYKCKKCRRPLFKSTSRLSHKVGRGEVAFDWRSSLPSNGMSDQDDGSESVCEQSLFIEPVKWMGEDVLALEGKIACPKCHAKLGSFTWSGERCACGTWVTPAFHIGPNKVDECRIRAVQPLPSTPLPPHAPNTGIAQLTASCNSPQPHVAMKTDVQTRMVERPVAKVLPMVQSLCQDEATQAQ